MVTVEQYAAHSSGAPQWHEYSGTGPCFHHSRYKIRQILTTPEPKRYQRLNPPPSILEPFQATIDSILWPMNTPANSGTRRPNCFAASARSLVTAAATARPLVCARSRPAEPRSVHSLGPRSGSTSGVRLRPHLR